MHFEKRHGTPVLALEHARSRNILGTCHEIEEEVYRILVEKFRWDPGVARSRLNFLLAKAIRVTITGNLHICRDPNDDMVLERAMVSGTQFIVSGDKDLLVLDPYNGIRIVTPAEFLAQGS